MNVKKETRTTILFQELEHISQGKKSYQTFLNELKEEKTFTSLKDFISDYMSHRQDVTIPSIIRDSNLSKNYVYHICDGRKNPSKYKLTALCIGAYESQRNAKSPFPGWMFRTSSQKSCRRRHHCVYQSKL